MKFELLPTERFHYGSCNYDFVLVRCDPLPVWKMLGNTYVKIRRVKDGKYSVLAGNKFAMGRFKTARGACIEAAKVWIRHCRGNPRMELLCIEPTGPLPHTASHDRLRIAVNHLDEALLWLRKKDRDVLPTVRKDAVESYIGHAADQLVLFNRESPP